MLGDDLSEAQSLTPGGWESLSPRRDTGDEWAYSPRSSAESTSTGTSSPLARMVVTSCAVAHQAQQTKMLITAVELLDKEAVAHWLRQGMELGEDTCNKHGAVALHALFDFGNGLMCDPLRAKDRAEIGAMLAAAWPQAVKKSLCPWSRSRLPADRRRPGWAGAVSPSRSGVTSDFGGEGSNSTASVTCRGNGNRSNNSTSGSSSSSTSGGSSSSSSGGGSG